MSTWVLLIILSVGPYTQQNSVTSSTIYFANEASCKGAELELDKVLASAKGPISYNLTCMALDRSKK